MDFSKLKRLGITSDYDLINHIPIRYVDYSNLSTIKKANVDDIVTIKGSIVSLKNIYTKRGLRMQIGSVEDSSDKLTIVWFNQPFLIKTFYPGREVALSGKVSLFSGRKSLVSPEYELISESHGTTHTGKLVPIYPETAGISSKWIRTRIRKVFDAQINRIKEYLPKSVLKKYGLIELTKAYKEIHFPKSLEAAKKAKQRLAFNELLNLELKANYRKSMWKRNKVTNNLSVNRKEVESFIKSLPFVLTNSQRMASEQILTDISGDYPMNRLLEGDVGSGKTAVAAIAAFVAFLNGYQTILMAPTQILVKQHFDTFQSLFSKYKVRLSLLTSESRTKEVGRTDIFIGTHALIHQKVSFDKVALVIIDEQHRFGVEQRAHLVKKSGTPHILTMTATPIPRTVAMTVYGDLDLSVLKELPKGRKKVTTWLVPPQKRKGAYDWIRQQVKSKSSQVFWICPLIELSEKETMKDIKSVTTEFENLKKTFSKLKLGLLHGRMKAKEKDSVLNSFKRGKTDILVATPVVEVGIDIPKATIMVIEASERFGLAQLHQLRGRVGRGETQSYCLLFANIKGSRRLTAMTKTNSGFELAELDLQIRGPGEIFGLKQSGFPQFKAASWSDTKLIAQAKEVAEQATNKPEQYPSLVDKTVSMV